MRDVHPGIRWIRFEQLVFQDIFASGFGKGSTQFVVGVGTTPRDEAHNPPGAFNVLVRR